MTTHMIDTDAALLEGIKKSTEFITLDEFIARQEQAEALEFWLTEMTTPRTAEEEAELEAERINWKAEREALAAERKANECGRCEGKGRIPAYYYIDNGTCFACCGTGLLG